MRPSGYRRAWCQPVGAIAAAALEGDASTQWSYEHRAFNLSFRGLHHMLEILMVGPVNSVRAADAGILLAVVLRNASAARSAFRQDALQFMVMHKEMSADRAWKLLVDRYSS